MEMNLLLLRFTSENNCLQSRLGQLHNEMIHKKAAMNFNGAKAKNVRRLFSKAKLIPASFPLPPQLFLPRWAY